MKYGIVISVSKTKFGPIVFKENLAENIKEASNLGYSGVELAIRKPEVIKINEVDKFLRKYSMEIISVGTGQIYFEEGLSFADPSKEVRKAAVERVKRIIEVARYFNASIIIGLIRGKIKNTGNFNQEYIKTEKNINNCIEELMIYSEKYNQKFLLEAINRYEVNIFNRLDETSDFLIKFKNILDLDRIGILADTFHMNIEEPVIHESIKKYSKLIKHIHFADSNRWPPGYGHIDFRRIINTLKDINYKNYISFEMLPLPDPKTAAKNALENIEQINKL
jgi:5-keto-L-gluconate epimerase